MIKKLISTFVFMLFIASTTIAQIELSNDFTSKLSQVSEYIGSNTPFVTSDGELYTYKSYKNKFTIYKIGSDLNEMQKVEGKINIPGIYIERLFSINDRFYFLGSKSYGINKLTEFYVTEIDLQSGNLLSEPKYILEKTIFKQEFFLNFNQEEGCVQELNILNSGKGNNIRIEYNLEDNKKNKNGKFWLSAEFDENFNLLWKNEVLLPYKSKLVKIADRSNQLDKTYVVYEVEQANPKKSVEEGEPISHFEMAYFERDGEVKYTKISLPENKKITSLKFAYDQNQQLILVGLFGRWKTNHSNGILYSTPVEDGNLTFELKVIPKDFFERYYRYTDKEGNEKIGNSISSVQIRKCVFEQDGSFTMIGENRIHDIYYTKEHTPYDIFYFRELVVFHLNKEGEFEYAHKINKLQEQATSISNHNIGAYNYSDDTYEYFFTLDNPNNIAIKGSNGAALQRMHRPGMLFAYRINRKTGEIKKYILMNTLDYDGEKHESYGFTANAGFQIDDNVFVYRINRGRGKKQYITFTLE